MADRRTDTGAIIDTNAIKAAMRETSYERANRLADEAKARTRAAQTDAWRSADWAGMLEQAYTDTVYRPTEIVVFRELARVTRRGADIHAVAIQAWAVRKRGAWANLRDLHAMHGQVLTWEFGYPAILLDADEDAA
jgi:hypothetical protein